MNIEIDQRQLSRELERLASFSSAPAPAVTRIVFSSEDLQARAYVKQLCTQAGLEVREDAAGNTFARWQGSDPDLPAVATGSHIDAIPHSGRYDGTVGVLGGLEAIRALTRAGFQPRRSLELLLFTSEEPTRFGIGCLGSRLLSRTLGAEADGNLKDAEGSTLAEVRQRAGFHGALADVALSENYYHAFLELHIEQGPLLERSRTPLGVVTAIAAPAGLRVTIEGDGGHAGAVLMPDRHDAFLAAAEIALAVEASARATRVIDTVGTVGICDLFPRAVNSIPSHVQMEIDVRDIDEARRNLVLDGIRAAIAAIAGRRGVRPQIELVNADAPAQCSPLAIGALTESCKTLGHAFQPMVSRAYHDSLFLSRIVPVAMLFIPCRNGYSHRPDEYASPSDIERGVQVLAHAMALLAGD